MAFTDVTLQEGNCLRVLWEKVLERASVLEICYTEQVELLLYNTYNYRELGAYTGKLLQSLENYSFLGHFSVTFSTSEKGVGGIVYGTISNITLHLK